MKRYIQLYESDELKVLLDAEAKRRGLDPESRGTKTALLVDAVREVYGPVDRSVLKAQLDMATDMLYRMVGESSAEMLRSGLLAPSKRILKG